MFYFKYNKEKIEKYHVTCNKEELEKLKLEIINNCSLINHVEYKSDYAPRFDDQSLIKNFQSTYVGKKEYFEETRDVYKYSYDEYKPPYLVELMNRFLNGDATSIDQILNYSIFSNESIDDKINQANQELSRIETTDIAAKKSKLKELENLLETKQLNKKRKNIDTYHKQLITLIRFDLVDSISISKIKRVQSFLDCEEKTNILPFNSQVNKIIKVLKNDK